MNFWVYFDETENGVVSVIAVTQDCVSHLSYIADAIWLIEDHVISWQKDNLFRKNEPTSVYNYHVALTMFWDKLSRQQIAIRG